MPNSPPSGFEGVHYTLFLRGWLAYPGGPSDQDGDGVSDTTDNCPVIYNPTQADTDGDGSGDACDVCPTDRLDDLDGDCFCANPDDVDGTFGFDDDNDGDGTPNVADDCPDDPAGAVDANGDGVCNDFENDLDGNGVVDVADACDGQERGTVVVDPYFLFAPGLGGTVADAGVFSGRGSWFALDLGTWLRVEMAPSATDTDGRGLDMATAEGFAHTGGFGAGWITQSEVDAPWSIYGADGVHFTVGSLPVTDNGNGTATVAMAAWRMAYDGTVAIDLGQGAPAVVDYGVDGVAGGGDDLLDYAATIPAGDPSGLGGTGYLLHLEGSFEALGGPDGDRDGDGLLDGVDNCPNHPNVDQRDTDGDGRGNRCDPCPTDAFDDQDGDCLCASPADPDGLLGFDGDNDGDGVGNSVDLFPDDPTEWADHDGDGIGDNSDPDDDNDGYPDTLEASFGSDPLVADTVAGDVDLSGSVSITDLVKVRRAFGSRCGDPGWDPRLDVNGSCTVSVTDLIVVRSHFGSHLGP